MLCEMGQTEEGYQHLRKSIDMAPGFPDAHNHLGWELAKAGLYDEAIDELQKAVTLRPNSVEYRVNLGYVMGLHGDYAGALATFQKAVEVSDGKDWRCLDMLATAYNKVGRPADAVRTEQQAFNLALQQHDPQLEQTLRGNLERYEREAATAQAQ